MIGQLPLRPARRFAVEPRVEQRRFDRRDAGDPHAQRAFETAQKTLVAIDQTREKAVNDVVRLK